MYKTKARPASLWNVFPEIRTRKIFATAYRHTVCYKEIRASTEMRALPSGTIFETLDIENFARHGTSIVATRYQFSSTFRA